MQIHYTPFIYQITPKYVPLSQVIDINETLKCQFYFETILALALVVDKNATLKCQFYFETILALANVVNKDAPFSRWAIVVGIAT